MSKTLEGKVAIVTGAGTGIGLDIARLFASEGATVALTGRREELLAEAVDSITAKGGSAVAIAGDASQEEDVEHLFKTVVEACGRLDVLVNNAAIAGEVGNIWELSTEGWNEAVAINLTGPWLCTRAAARVMMPQGSGKIVNIGSISGKRPLARRTPYTATKMGLVGLTKTAALELGEYGINVNLISPGAVETPRLALLAEAANRPLDEMLAGIAATSALKRVGQPEDIANAALFLATDAARHITGVDLTVDAGTCFI